MGSEDRFSKLDAGPIRETIERLHRRIAERFPQSGLSEVAAELADLARENEAVIIQLRKPILWLRILEILALVALLSVLLWMAFSFLPTLEGGKVHVIDVIQALDAAINELILLSLAVFFLVSLEMRFKRRTALAMLHRFRSLAHIVDMHQLTKDPEHVLRPVPATASSPQRHLTRAELTRYLEYCSELLALVSKLAALHAQDLQDPVVLEAVNDLESLTADLARNIWQKITILDVAGAAGESLSR